jgi:gas vesicle protein
MSHSHNHNHGFSTGLIFGSIIGIIGGILLAPKPGTEMRSDLKVKTEDILDKTEKFRTPIIETITPAIVDISHKLGPTIESTKIKLEPTIKSIKEKLTPLIEQVTKPTAKSTDTSDSDDTHNK